MAGSEKSVPPNPMAAPGGRNPPLECLNDSRCELHHAGSMDDDIPVIVRMRVECDRCGHAEDDTYEFDLPLGKAQTMEQHVLGKCPKCGARLR